jgi:hypothetical protein
MAAAGGAPYRSADVAERFGAKDERGASVHREALIRKGLIWSPRRGQVDFTVPLFALVALGYIWQRPRLRSTATC